MESHSLGLTAPTNSLEFTASDGTVLAADLYEMPGRAAPAPVIVMFTPYLKGQVIPPFLPVKTLLENGYVVVAVDIRGTGESGGVFQGPLSSREVHDGAEFVEWLAIQEFCTGKVGLASGSYPGAIQFLIAAQKPKGLVCIAPGYAPIDFFRDWTHRGGIPSHSNWGAATFLQTNQPRVSVRPALDFYYGSAQATPVDGPLFWERSPYRVLTDIDVPVLFIGGLYDYFGRGTLRGFEETTAPKRLVFGPWGHQYPDDPTELLAWFDYWMRGIGDDPSVGENLRMFVIGDDEWVSASCLPQTRLELPFDATLEVPVAESERSWPMDIAPSPVPYFMDTGTSSGMHLWGESVTIDLDAADVVVRGVAILALTITALGCDDADLHARLSLVSEEGDLAQLTEGRLRLSHRQLDPERTRFENGQPVALHHSHLEPVALPEGQAVEVFIEFLPTSVAVRGKARLRLGLSAVRTDGGARPGRITLSAASRVVLPVVE